ncbi:MAG: GDSL-type esterase/lipase family protein [Verrucomicrobia bacterium]|nr:GDSL-type esterase/lipase family protein [Verrucomicrobiota bacterium]
MTTSRFQSLPLLALSQVVFSALSILGTTAQETTPKPTSEKWEEKIKEFEEMDAASPPAPGQVLFVGSSSIVGWDLPKSFPDLKALNRGFGGSEVVDSLFFADRIIRPYKPKKIFLYAGDNDIGSGKSARVVFDDFVKLAEWIEVKLPETELIFIAIKPSIKRWNLWPEMQRANDLVAGYAQAKRNVSFADITTATLGDNGQPDPTLFEDDGLHLNAKGYAAWNTIINTFLND